jgi:arylsulfatase A-like enzyme
MQRRPNIVLVLTDDQGYGDLCCTGNPYVRTPNVDAFHAQSVRLTDYHVGPTCAPTRAGLLTGHYANSTGVWHTIGGRSLLRENEWTLADALSESGYTTGIFGKWHLGDTYPYRPHDRGFHSAVVHGGGGITQTPDFWGNDYFDDTYFVNGEPRRFEGYCTDVWFDLATRFISDHKDEPFFCYISTNAPHSPYNVEDCYADPYRGNEPEPRARFHGMVTNIDENFGRLRSHLESLGLDDNTILIFMTDNGTSGGARADSDGHIVDGYNAGMRGIKGSPYDGGHRVPCFIRYPAGGIGGGVDVLPITANVDFMPTMLDLCGVTVPEERAVNGRVFDGRSIVPLLAAASGEVQDRATDWPERAIVTDSQRLTHPVKWRQSAVMTDRWRLVNGSELYDMTADPRQRTDVAAANPDVVTELKGEYDSWWEKVSVQFDRATPHAIGSEGWSCSTLTSHDLRNEECDVAWNQGLIRAGRLVDGWWEVRIERAGRYTFELRRWPVESGHALDAGIDGSDIEWRRDAVSADDWSLYEGGTPLAITRASISVAGRSDEQAVAAGAVSAVFTLELPAGDTTLTARFTAGGRTIAAYYVSVTSARS